MAQEQVGSLDGRLLRGNIGVKEVPAKPPDSILAEGWESDIH